MLYCDVVNVMKEGVRIFRGDLNPNLKFPPHVKEGEDQILVAVVLGKKHTKDEGAYAVNVTSEADYRSLVQQLPKAENLKEIAFYECPLQRTMSTYFIGKEARWRCPKSSTFVGPLTLDTLEELIKSGKVK